MSQSSKSIRFQIELPIEHVYHKTPNIHVHINFDQLENRTKEAVTNSNSGYSTSYDFNSSELSIDSSSPFSSFSSDCDRSSCDIDTSTSSGSQSPAEIHTYNKLSNQRSQVTRLEPIMENIYEDISSFLESNGYINLANKSNKIILKKPIEKSNSESNSANLNRPQTKTIVLEKSNRRDYVLNEIFDDLKKFKQQAKNQETLARSNNNLTGKIVISTISAGNNSTRIEDQHVYINQMKTNFSTLV